MGRMAVPLMCLAAQTAAGPAFAQPWAPSNLSGCLAACAVRFAPASVGRRLRPPLADTRALGIASRPRRAAARVLDPRQTARGSASDRLGGRTLPRTPQARSASRQCSVPGCRWHRSGSLWWRRGRRGVPVRKPRSMPDQRPERIHPSGAGNSRLRQSRTHNLLAAGGAIWQSSGTLTI